MMHLYPHLNLNLYLHLLKNRLKALLVKRLKAMPMAMIWSFGTVAGHILTDYLTTGPASTVSCQDFPAAGFQKYYTENYIKFDNRRPL